MVVVSARDAGVGAQQIQFVAVPGPVDQYDIINGAQTVAYEMCGLGEHCSIASGTPSTDRDRLLRREALEIALYTFKYVGSTDAVVVFMPPPPGATTSWALLFQKQNYGGELGHPITKTLAEPAPDPATLANSSERDLVEQLTGNARYSYKVQDVNGAPVLVLDVPADVSAESRAALERARRRLDTLDYYRASGPDAARPPVRGAVVLPAAAVPPLRRIRGAQRRSCCAFRRTGRRVGRPRDARALPRLADAAPPVQDAAVLRLGAATRANRYEAEARRAAAETRA